MEAMMKTFLALLLLIATPAFAAPPPWAKNVKTTVTKSADSEEVVVEVDGVKAGYRYDHGKRYDLKWERDPKTLGLRHRLHAHEITRVFPDELEPLHAPQEALSDVVADMVPDASPSNPATIDVNYWYSAAAATANGGEATMPAFAALSIALANQTYANSGMSYITWRMFGPFKASYADTTNLSDALTWMGTTGAGASEIAAKYALTGADCSQMTVKNSGGGCGLGWLTSSSSNALSVTDRTCANSNLSSPHEIGHNIGFNHDPPNAQCNIMTSPVSRLQCCGAAPSTGQCTSSNYGHSWPVGAVQWRDIMAYPGALGTRITQISNPNVKYQGLYPTGIVNERDNAKVAVARAPVVAGFRTAVVTTHKPPSRPTTVTVTP